ncbi:MAG: Ppx/GppA phosphatase family protein [Frankiaceae bacterium]|jgi:exopolyphosphatase/guanosine-5'-triphosphate,3'-diphosphate pyrophosphatase
MRLGVLDVGSNTIHLLVVDAHLGGRPLPAAKVKFELRLAELLDRNGSLPTSGATALVDAVRNAGAVAQGMGVEDFLAFATSAVRDATNGEQVLDRIRDETGVKLEIMSGQEEARLTFLAVRRWFGWGAGRLLVFDIGGGSLEVAAGSEEQPDVAVSLPLGAGRLTRDWLSGDRPDPKALRDLRKHVRKELAKCAAEFSAGGEPDRVVATSKTFRSLARIGGAAPYVAGPYVRRTLRRDDVRGLVERLAKMRPAERAALPGVSPGRAPQLPAGAIVADAAMEMLSVAELELCPWALREGLLLRRMDHTGPS